MKEFVNDNCRGEKYKNNLNNTRHMHIVIISYCKYKI